MEKEIRQIIDKRIADIKNRNVDGATADYSEDVIFYDVIGQLKLIGIGAIKRRLNKWLSTLSEIINYEIADVKIVSSSETAYCSSLNHINAKTIDGNKLDMWWRETTCYSIINGKIKITHAHSSVPFNVENGMASVDLKPDINEQKPQKEESGYSPGEIAKRLYQAFQNQERNVLENLFSSDFTFSSPDDKNLNKEQFFEICYPFCEKVKNFEFLKIMESGNDVFVVYRCSAKNLPDFENTEHLIIEDGKVKSVRVFYGDK
jgi:ketosteroid isomerase-like protein